MWYKRGLSAAGRDITVGVAVGHGNYGFININPFKHRTWNHFCWSYDSSSAENRIYLNGKFYGSLHFESKREALGSHEVFGSSFSVGQEPDAFRGKYDREQAFRGNMSEINLWDYVITDEEMFNIGTCKKRGKGNVIAWERKQFKLYNLTEDILEDVDELCMPEEKIFVFPEKYSLPFASALCQSHGGYLYTPRNEQDNIKLTNEIKTYESKCLQKSSGNVFWLGATTKKFQPILQVGNQRENIGNSTNWGTPLFEPANKCVYMKMDGTWIASNTNCVRFELCPVCAFIGTPILTLKGISS